MKAYLYTWGEGRNTAEGEHIPVRIESLDIGYIDGQLLLPLIEEHTIDERSPLCGHTYMSLKSVRVVAETLDVAADIVPPAPVALCIATEVNSCFANSHANSAIRMNKLICFNISSKSSGLLSLMYKQLRLLPHPCGRWLQ